MTTVYLAFALVAPAVFWLLPLRTAILLTVFGGWLVLPVGSYPALDPDVRFPWWITGLALPGEMLMSKAWVVPMVALVTALLFDPARPRQAGFSWIDLPMTLWCLWPLIGGRFAEAASPAPLAATLYLAGSWGALWCLGRLWFAGPRGHRALLRGCAWAGVACLPFAILEGGMGISLYSEVFGLHPYRDDGVNRYFGFRPVGFFEHGNQYGIWVAVSALAAIWLALSCDRTARGVTVALVATLIALMAQSVGALLLCAASLLLLSVWRLRLVWPLLVIGLGGLVLITALHLSGLVPLRWLAKETGIGQLIVAAFKSFGRGSFTWRFAQDLKTMALIDNGWLMGKMVWDWWRPAGIRPWGLWLLLVGQYGLAGFALAYGAVLAAAVRMLRQLRGAAVWTGVSTGLPLALIVLMTLADSMLNAFLYFPGLVAAGALATRRPLAIDPDTSGVTPSP